eukprot:354266-Chlamydomonas_euryale.AAC.27
MATLLASALDPASGRTLQVSCNLVFPAVRVEHLACGSCVMPPLPPTYIHTQTHAIVAQSLHKVGKAWHGIRKDADHQR